MLHPDSGCFLIFQVNTRERYRKPLLLEEKGKAKGSPSVMKKLQ
jgi:predicted transcriptional regulator